MGAGLCIARTDRGRGEGLRLTISASGLCRDIVLSSDAQPMAEVLRYLKQSPEDFPTYSRSKRATRDDNFRVIREARNNCQPGFTGFWRRAALRAHRRMRSGGSAC